jgi:hypothetical protein
MTKMKKSIAILLAVLFIVTLTSSVISASSVIPVLPPHHSILYAWGGGWGGWGVLR